MSFHNSNLNYLSELIVVDFGGYFGCLTTITRQRPVFFADCFKRSLTDCPQNAEYAWVGSYTRSWEDDLAVDAEQRQQQLEAERREKRRKYDNNQYSAQHILSGA